jgi:hypothetical protein
MHTPKTKRGKGYGSGVVPAVFPPRLYRRRALKARRFLLRTTSSRRIAKPRQARNIHFKLIVFFFHDRGMPLILASPPSGGVLG